MTAAEGRNATGDDRDSETEAPGPVRDGAPEPRSDVLTVSAGNLALYSVMAFPLAFAGLPIYLHAPDFYAVTLQQPLAALGTVLLALRLIDAVQDPLIGSLSDRFHSSRQVIILLGCVLLGAGFWMLFHPPAHFPLAWFSASVLLCTTGFSVVSINFQALGGLWRTPAAERTKITATREAFGLTGLLFAAVVPSALARVISPAGAFHWLTLLYLPLLAVAFWALTHWMKTAPLTAPMQDRNAARWWPLLRDRWRGLFFGLVFLNSLASAVPAVLVLFFIRDRLGAEAYTGLFLLIYFLFGVLSMPLWTRLARSLGKLKTWRVSLLAAIATFCWAVLLQEGDLAAYAAVCALSGLALGADLALPPAILADHIDADRRQQEASRLFSLMALLSKSALALATGLALPALGALGYRPNAAMTPDLDLALSLTYAGVPCLLKLGALAGLYLFEKDLASNKTVV